MTELDLARDSRDSYSAAIAALRMRAVVSGDAPPRPDEPLDIVLLAALAGHSP